MPNQRQDRIGLLVVRAFVEAGRRRMLLVRLLEVSPPGPDRVIGTAGSSKAASRLVGEWLDSLVAEPATDGSGQPGDGQPRAPGHER